MAPAARVRQAWCHDREAYVLFSEQRGGALKVAIPPAEVVGLQLTDEDPPSRFGAAEIDGGGGEPLLRLGAEGAGGEPMLAREGE